MRSDYGDLRFIENATGGWIPYVIMENTADNATIGIRRIENADNSIYMYYGNAAATDSSRGDNVWIYYENFNSRTVGDLNGQDGWSGDTNFDVTTSNPHEGAKTLIDSATSGEIIRTIPSLASGRALVWRMHSTTTAQSYFVLREGTGVKIYTALFTGYMRIYNGSIWAGVKAYSTNTYYRNEILWDNNQNKLIADTVDSGWSAGNGTWSTINNIRLLADTGAGDKYWDTIAVGRYSRTEPTLTMGAEESPTPSFKSLGKPVLILPENNQENYVSQNQNFEWTPGENSENSRLEVFNSLGVCVDNQTFAVPISTYFKLEGLPTDNYTWRVWAENKNNANSENASDIFTFEYVPISGAPTGTTSTIYMVFGVVGLIFFIMWLSSRRK